MSLWPEDEHDWRLEDDDPPPPAAQVAADLDRYWQAMGRGDSRTCLAIEERYGLDGYPPSIVTAALRAGAEGADMDAAIDALLGDEGEPEAAP